MENQSEKSGDPMTMGKLVATSATIVGLFVTTNTLLSNCSKESLDRSKSFRETVFNEEKFWSDLYAKFLGTITTPNADEKMREKQLTAIAFAATHQVPDLQEYKGWYGNSEREVLATKQLASMRQSLHDALRNPEYSNDQTARKLSFFLDSNSNVRDRAPADSSADSAPPPITDRAKAITSASIQTQTSNIVIEGETKQTYGSITLGTGPIIGWDVDVFWCEGGADELARYTKALKIGQTLASAAQAETTIAPGMKLGRIRLRSLPVSQQGNGMFYTSGDAVVADSGVGEMESAGKLGAFISSKTALPLRTVKSIGVKTNWYLSAFICTPK